MSIGEFAQTRTVELEKLKIGLQAFISNELIDASVDIARDYLTNHIAVEIRGYIWSEKETVQKQSVSFPSNWKESFKQRWFSRWMLAKWPVKYTKFCVDVKAIYPEFRPSLPNQTYRLITQSNVSYFEEPK